MYSPKLREPARRELLPVFVARMRAPAMRFRLGIERDDMGVRGTTWGFQTEAYRPADPPQSSVVEMGRRRCVPVFGLLFTGSRTTLPCSPGLNARAAARCQWLRRQKDLAAGGR